MENIQPITAMYVKLFCQILDSSIADNRRLRHFFTDLLLCSDAKGYVMMTPQAIARRIGTSVDEVTWGLEELVKPDPSSKTQDFDGARIEKLEGVGYGWRIINYESYRSLKDADQLRESTKLRVQRFRAKKVTSVTLGNGSTEADTEAEEISHPDKRDEKEKIPSLKDESESVSKDTPPSSARPPRKPKKAREASCDGIEFAVWFRSMLPDDVRLSENWENSWGLVYDDLIRIDKRDHDGIVAVCKWGREDRFWASAFQAPTKLRDRDQQGAQYYDVLQARMKQPTGYQGPQKPTKADDYRL